MKKLIFAVSFALAIIVCATGATTPKRAMCDVTAEHAVIVELNSGSIISGKNHNERASMASTTKIMTALLLCERADLDREITVTDQMVRVEGSSMGLLAGDRVHYRDLLYGMLLASGNDAANATAISLGGSIKGFADMMNERAQEIGMFNTHFVTPSGLDDDEHYTTAYDMALLACEAMKNDHFAEACSSSYATLEYGNPPFRRTLKNHNKLLKLYDDCIGVKTGFTKKSGRCLVSCAVKDGKGVVAVTLNAPDDWNDHIRMLDYGISVLEQRQLSVPKIGSVKVIGGNADKVFVNAQAPSVSLIDEDFERVTSKVELCDAAFAPIKQGEALGQVEWQLDGKTVAIAKLCAKSDVAVFGQPQKRNIFYWVRQMISA